MRHRRSALISATLVASVLGAAGARAGLTGAERLEGTVLDGGGTPAGGAVVSMSGSGIRREALTNNGGGFEIDLVTPGVYQVSAATGTITSEEIRVEVKDGEAPPHITLTLKPPRPVERVTTTFPSAPIAGRLEVFLAGENLLNDRFETRRTPVVTLGPPRAVPAGVRRIGPPGNPGA